MTDFSQREIDRLIKANEDSAKNSEATVEYLKTLTSSFQEALSEITSMRQEITELRQEVGQLKDPKKASISFTAKKREK